MKIRPEDHLGLAHNVASKFVRNYERVEDSIEYSLACEALILASQTYDPNQGAFSTVAYKSISNKLIDHKRNQTRQKRQASFESTEDLDFILDELQWEDNQIDDVPNFMGWLNQCNWNDEEKNDLEVLMAVKIKSESITQIADKLGVSRPTIYLKLNRITDKIRQRYAA